MYNKWKLFIAYGPLNRIHFPGNCIWGEKIDTFQIYIYIYFIKRYAILIINKTFVYFFQFPHIIFIYIVLKV